MNREILKMLKTMDSRLSRLEKKKTKDSDDPDKKTEDDDGEDDPKDKTKDDGDLTEPEGAEKLSDAGVQTYTGDSLKEVLSRAEILSPGYRMPTFDSANNGKAVLNTKRAVLKTAYATQDGQKAIAPFVGPNPDFDKLPNIRSMLHSLEPPNSSNNRTMLKVFVLASQHVISVEQLLHLPKSTNATVNFGTSKDKNYV